jgi:formylglycine-generating enzyme required for sulfatase activity
MNAPEITPQSSLKSSLPPAIEVETVWHYGNINVETDQAGDLYIDNALVQSLAQGQGAKLRVLTGFHSLELHTADDVHKQEVTLATDQTVTAKFVFGLPLQSAASKAVYQPKSRLDLVFVEGGTFAMGDSTAEAQSNEKPVHQMEIGSFYISKYEITQKQWQDVMEVNPAYFKGEYLPVERISWYDAIEFCNTLSQKEGLTPVYTLNDDKVDTNNLCAADNLKLTIIANFSADGYRLPTEAEWEFAARGGIQSSGYKYCAANDIEQAAWYDSNSEGKTHSVGRKLANELGIYDMSGSVWEWCWDWYGSDYYSNYYHHNQSKYPAGPISGEQRVLRGGSWITDAEHCRISYRYSDKPNNNIYAEYGLRPVRVVK